MSEENSTPLPSKKNGDQSSHHAAPDHQQDDVPKRERFGRYMVNFAEVFGIPAGAFLYVWQNRGDPMTAVVTFAAIVFFTHGVCRVFALTRKRLIVGLVSVASLVGCGGWFFTVKADKTAIGSPVTNVLVFTADPAAQSDFIPGTRVTHKMLEEEFPYGYVVFSEKDGNWIKSVKPADKYRWGGDWDSVKLSADFSKRIVAVNIPNLSMKKQTDALQIENTVVQFSAPIKTGLVKLISDGITYIDNEPAMFFGTLSDNQRFPVFVIGFKIGPPGAEIERAKQEYLKQHGK